jgi:hypothetical protein
MTTMTMTTMTTMTTTQFNADMLNQLDARVGSVAPPAHAAHGPQYLPAPLRATYEETQAAGGATFTVTITRDAERFIEARREERDAARGRVLETYRSDKRPGAEARRVAALAALTPTIPSRAEAEERAAVAVAGDVEETWTRVLAELRSLYPND